MRFGDGDGDAKREAQLLRAVAEICEVPVPTPLRASASWMAYRRLDGVPLIDLPPAWRARHATRVAATVGSVLADLWATAPDTVRGLVEEDDAPLEEWRDEAADRADELAGALPDGVRAHVDDFLRARVPAAGPRRVFSHNDLGIEHVLVDPGSGAVTGIIDWSDAAIVDPAKDLGLVLRDLGPAALDVVLDRAGATLGPDGALRERAAFYARCLALEDLAFGLQTGQAKYAEAARHALTRLLQRRQRSGQRER